MDVDILDIARIEREITGLPQMTIFEATMICEGNWELAGYEPDDQTATDAWQRLIDTGTCWHLQGWFGRQATALIQAGVCTR